MAFNLTTICMKDDPDVTPQDEIEIDCPPCELLNGNG